MKNISFINFRSFVRLVNSILQWKNFMSPAVLALLGFFSFTLMDLSIKWLLQSYSLLQVTFFNCLFALIGLLIWLYPNWQLLKTKQPRIHLLRTTLIVVIDLLAFYSYGHLPLAQAYTLILTMPLFTAILAIILKQEAFNPQYLLLSLIGFSGVCLVLAPSFGSLQMALFAALASAAIESLNFLLIARYKEQDSPQTFAIYGLGLIILLTGVYTVFYYQPLTLNAFTISLGGGLCYALATACVVKAFHDGSPTVVSSMQYSQLLWGAVFGFMLWAEIPEMRVITGGVIITLAGLKLLHLQRRPSVNAPSLA